MPDSPLVLDTDILSAMMRKTPSALACAASYLQEHGHFTLSLISRYEILRGLRARRATRQASDFDRFCAQNAVLSITDDVVVKAAEIYGDLSRRGKLIGDADILVAASALVGGFGVATNNEDHFSRIAGLEVVNWLRL